MREPKYKVVWPLGRSAYEMAPLAPRIPDFKDKTVCELSDLLFKTEEVFPLIRESLLRQYPGINFVDYTTFGNIHGSEEATVIAALPTLLRKHQCDAVISGIGG